MPPLKFLMIDGHGDPNTSTAYREVVEALYAASYAVRAVAKSNLDKVHAVGPLTTRKSSEHATRMQGDWTLMIVQPDWITPELIDVALAGVRKKRLPSLDRVRFGSYVEGRSVHILHVGSYDDEGPTLERLHGKFCPRTDSCPLGAIMRSTSPIPARSSLHGSGPSCANLSAPSVA